MEILKNAPLFSRGEKVFIIFSILGFLLAILTMPGFGMPREFHLFVGIVAAAFAIANMFRWTNLTGPAGVLVWSVIAAICYGVYAGYIVQ